MRSAVAALVAAVALTLAATAAAHHSKHHPPNCGNLRPHREFVCARKQLMQAKRHPGTHSRGYWRWREKVAHRWIVSARYRLAHPPIAHLALWECIHGGEGNSGTSAEHPNSGPLQMSPYWAGYPVRDWSLLPVHDVYADAEEQLRKHEREGNAVPWLWTQWWGDHACFYLA